MKYIAAYLLAVMGGQETPTSDDVRNVITSVGIEVDEEKLKLVMEKLKGKNVEEIQEEGLALLANSVFCTSNTCTPEDNNAHDVTAEPGIAKTLTDLDTDDDDDEDESFMNLFGD